MAVDVVSKEINELFVEERWADARQIIEKELKSLPESDSIRHWWLARLSTVHYEMHHYGKALESAEQSRRIRPNCPLAIWENAGALDMLGREREAIQLYLHLVSRGVRSIARDECGEGVERAKELIADCRFRLSCCYEELGDYGSASHYRQAFSRDIGAGVHSLYRLEDLPESSFDSIRLNTTNQKVRYFVTVFGSQSRLNRPKNSHTYATFLERQSGIASPLREFTISWLPKDGEIDPLGPPEPGRNFTYEETIEWLDASGSDRRWESAETEIRPVLFHSAKKRFEELEASALKYKMIDSFATRPHKVSNCIHAVSDLSVSIAKLGKAFTGTLRGISASRFVYHYLSPFYLEPTRITEREEKAIEELQRASLKVAMTA